MYLRLRSKTTGHQWDASEIAARAYLASGGVEIARPPRPGSRPGRAKPQRRLGALTPKTRPQPPKEMS